MRCSQEVAQNWKENPSAQVKESRVECTASAALEEKGWLEKSNSPVRARWLSRAGPRPPAGRLEEVSGTQGGTLQEEAGQPGGLFPKAGTVALKQIQFFSTVSRLFLESLRFRIKFFLKLWEVLLLNKGSTGTPGGLTPCQTNKGGALRNNHRSV